jgi:hypothetical protein
MSCACRKEGASCGPSCDCAHYDIPWGSRAQRCRSPFSKLPHIFASMPARRVVPLGLTPAWCVTRANYCFKKYLNLEPKKERQLDVDSLTTKIMADSEAWHKDNFLKFLRLRLEDDATEGQEKKDLRISLMEYALGKRKDDGEVDVKLKHPDSHVWSLCKDQWVSRVECRHCEDCNMCYDNAWHCKGCGKCKVGHWWICDDCGRKSLTGATFGVLNGGTAEGAHTAQRGHSLGRPKKRSRQVDSDPELNSVSEVNYSESLFMFNNTDITTMQTNPEAPDDINTRPCNCKDSCTTRRCTCRRWGGQCKHNCKCNVDTDFPCENIFYLNEYRFFGLALPGKVVPRATPCFTHYVEKALKIGHGRELNEKNGKVSVETLESMLLAKGNDFDMVENLTDLPEKLNFLAADSGERKVHLWRLF